MSVVICDLCGETYEDEVDSECPFCGGDSGDDDNDDAQDDDEDLEDDDW